MSINTINFSEDTFETDVLKCNKPVLVDFWAEWCGPCKMLTPIIDELATEYTNKIIIGKINVDNYPTIASRYGIRSIPCILFFKNGEVQNQIMGAVSKSEISKVLDEMI